MTTRAEKWHAFDNQVRLWAEKPRAPAFVQEVLKGGLWCVQELRLPTAQKFGWLHRILFNPPQDCAWQPYYIGWPGDHRGWMHFQTKEDARDFYKFATRRMSFKDYQAIERAPYSGHTIDLDANGDFVE